ncbi:uncharacterized protein LOC109424051 [Aedes albopictus]|uniref:Extracellular protein sel-1 n=1 Tax=Aedes albopictus TaxID=7160 RepID=A0ABM1XR81_AEDAL
MWKYVSRRIRDVCDRTYNTVLDVRRPWQCGGERLCNEGNHSGGGDGQQQQQQQQQQPQQDDKVPQQQLGRATVGGTRNGSYCLLNVVRNQLELNREKQKHYGAGGSRKEGFRRKEFCPFQPSWLGAITWTGAIICGWYTSQLICLNRRTHPWEGPKCLPYLISSAHKLPRDLQNGRFSNCFPFSTPPSPSLESVPEAQQQSTVPSFLGLPIPTAKPSRLSEYDFDEYCRIFEINNDGQAQSKQQLDEHVTVHQLRPEPKAPTIETAMENLVSIIGEIEYQLGVQNQELGDYRTAVSHWKLGTSHQHAGAAFNLGICYEQGFGVKKNARVAMECYHLASTLGHAQAMYNLGVYYARGLGGLRRSRSMAKKCFTAAADLGLEDAIVALGSRYNKQPSRRSSVFVGSPPGSPQSMTGGGLNDFKFDYEIIERIAGFDVVKAPEQPERPELRLVSAMA